jgi:O-antigen/teichoic acid export membrane protein
LLSVWALATIPLILFSDILLSVNVALGRIVLANWCRLIGPVMIVTATVLLVLADEVTATRVVAVSVVAGVPPIVIGCLGLPWRHIALKASELIADLKFGVKAHLASVLGIANFRLDLVFMSAFVSATQLGYYGVANNMMMPVMTVAQAAAMLLTPRVAGMGRGDDRGGVDDAQLARIRTDGRRFVWLGLAGAALVAALAPVAVPLVFGSAFQPVVVLVWVLLPGYIARNYAVMITAGALGARRPWVGNVVEGAGLVITVTLLPLLLPRYEAMGAAITSTVAYSASALVAVLAIRRIGRRMPRSTASAVDEAETGAPHATGAVTVRAG